MLQEFTQEIEDTARAVVNDIHTAMPGQIISFSAGSGTADIQPVGKFVTADGKALDYPMLTEVPVVFPFSGRTGLGLAFPVKEGDSCIVIISEVELDAWRSGAESEGSLRFDLTSAVAVPGLLKSGNRLITKAVEENAVVIGTEKVSVSVGSTGILVDAGGTKLSVSESGITAGGNLRVEGNIFYTGTCNVAK